MKNFFISALTVLCILMQAGAQENNIYSFATLPDSLKKGAHAVYRLDEAELEVVSASKYVLKVHQVVTLLDSGAAGHLQHQFGTDKFFKVDAVDIKVYNKQGIEVQQYGEKHFEMHSAFDGVSFVTDDKVMRLYTPAPEYPCTIDVRYQLTASAYIDLPDWYINTNGNTTELFKYTVKVPSAQALRFRARNIELQPVIETNEKQKVYTWKAKDIAAKPIEQNSYDARYYLPHIEVAPALFEYDGYKGGFGDWKEFGKWNYDLYQVKNAFSSNRAAEIKALAETAADVKGKVNVLYQYLQANMRYVSIQLGIGGFKPFPVQFVDEKRYGDCKALTNYMRYMLAVAGITSYPALINAGYNKAPADPQFPAQIFNHVILCVPNNKDTIWLECTSNNNTTGFLGSFTENKRALLLTESGGVLVNTPASSHSSNQLVSHTDIFIKKEGSAEVKSRLYSTGDVYNLFHQVSQLSNENAKEILIKYLDFREPEQFTFESSTGSGEKNNIGVNMFYAKAFDFSAGNKLFFQQGISRFCSEDLKMVEHRSASYIFEYPYGKLDTTIFHLPDGFAVENVPVGLKEENEFAGYEKQVLVEADGKRVVVISKLVLKHHVIPAADYLKVAAFFRAVNKKEAEKIVLIKN